MRTPAARTGAAPATVTEPTATQAGGEPAPTPPPGPDLGECALPADEHMAFTELPRTAQVGFKTDSTGGVQPVPNEALLITGDLNIVDVQMTIAYRIADIDGIARVADPTGCPDGATLRDAAQAALGEVVGGMSIDAALGDGLETIRAETALLLQDILDNYRTGIEIDGVQLISVTPPAQVMAAFEDVIQAREDRETAINEALAGSRERAARAQVDADEIVANARSSAPLLISQVEADANRFVTTLRAFDEEPNTGLRALHLESLEGVLPGVGPFLEAVGPSAFARGRPRLVGYVVPNTRGAPRTQLDDAPTRGTLLRVTAPPFTASTIELQLLQVDAYARYRVVDEALFASAYASGARAEGRLANLLVASLREVVATSTREEVIGADLSRGADGGLVVTPTGSRNDLHERLLASVRQAVSDFDGGAVEVVDARIRRVSFPTDIAESIYSRMRAEREVRASRLRAEGEELAREIVGEAEHGAEATLAEARRTANSIAAEARSVAVDILLTVLAGEPGLAHYEAALEAYRISGGSD